jgi:pyrroloquinoline-quinone synthase
MNAMTLITRDRLPNGKAGQCCASTEVQTEMAISAAADFLRQLDSEIHAHPFLTDPFMKRMSTPGAISREQARRFAVLYYPHIFRTRLYQANTLGISPDESIQFVLAEILYDEYGNGDKSRSHPAIYRKFMRALEVPQSEYSIEPRFPELVQYIDAMMHLTQSGDWLAAAAAVGIASEWPIPKYYGDLLIGLRSVPGIAEDDLELFTSHIGIDEHHSAMMHEALAPYAESANEQLRIRAGVAANLDARRVMLQGLNRLVFAS